MTLRFLLILAALALFAARPAYAVPGNLPEAAAEAEADHRFDDAERFLRAQLRLNPRDGASWLRLASVATVRADVDAARSACAKAATFVEPIAVLACRGRVALVTQDYQAAYDPLSRLLEHPLYRSGDDPWTLWASGVAAELAAALGLHEQADRFFARALASQPSVQLRAAWLDHLLVTGRGNRVLSEVTDREPQAALQLRRLIALRQLHREAEAASLRDYYDWENRLALENGEYLHAREIARFYLDVIPEAKLALEAAENNLDRQKEAEDYELYHRALAANE